MSLLNDPTVKTSRLEALSDGVFAIVMTILVFEVSLPENPEGMTEAAVWRRLFLLIPTLFSYVVSFIILGIYWVGHRNQFNYIERADLTLTWLNLFFLMFVALVPFSASLIGAFPGEPPAIIVYGINLIAVALFHLSMWFYATRNNRLVYKDIPPNVIQLGMALSTAPLAAYFLAIILAPFNTLLSLAVFALTPIPYVLGLAYRIHLKT